MERMSVLAARLEAPVYAGLRMVTGAMFAVHGAQKVLGMFASTLQPAAGSQLWVGGVIEMATGLLIAAGLFTRAAAFLAAGTMAVAYLQFHWKLQLGNMLLPNVNQGELAVLYCFAFLLILTRGAGRASLDARLRAPAAEPAPSGVGPLATSHRQS
jgi:putative oxidoreductase